MSNRREEEKAVTPVVGGRAPFTQEVANLGRTLITNYPETNRDGSTTLDAANEGAGQAWRFRSSIRQKVLDILFFLNCNDAFAGTLVARIYDITGQAGTTGRPTGAALATSDAKTQADLQDSVWQLVNFHFSTPYVLDPDKSYAFVVELTACTGGELYVGIDTSDPIHNGNYCYAVGAGWVADDSIDVCFYVYESLILDTDGTPVSIVKNNRYYVFDLDTSVVRADVAIGLQAILTAAGAPYATYLLVIQIGGGISYRINDVANALLTPAAGEYWDNFEFTELYITNAAVAGTARIQVEYRV